MNLVPQHFRPLIYAMPLLLCLVAINQIRLAKHHYLSPWNGGGFGMFASNVSTGSRMLVCVGINDFGHEVRLSPMFEKLDTETWSKDFAIELMVNPTLDKLQKITNALLKKNYVQKLNYDKQVAAEILGWSVTEAVYVPLRAEDLKLAYEKTYSFSRIKTAIYELRYNSEDNSVKFFELLQYQASK